MGNQGYRTVGELAREVGTTVRTIQYYDQQGLLSPSAKGPGNQRLYASEDVEKLYRILTLKYLGLSLADIREQKDTLDDAASFREVLSRTKTSLEEDFQNLMKRMSVLRSLNDLTSDVETVNWTLLAQTIESDESDELFWDRMSEMPTPIDGDALYDGPRKRVQVVAKWHELIADAIAFISDHVPPDDPRCANLALRYRQLEDEQAGSLDQIFIIAENVTPHKGMPGSFDALRDSVVKFLADARQVHDGSTGTRA